MGCGALIQDQDENYLCGRAVVGESSRCEHVWDEFPGGPPSYQHYKWCRRCGVMAIECHGEPTEYYVAGTVVGSHRNDAPLCNARRSHE